MHPEGGISTRDGLAERFDNEEVKIKINNYFMESVENRSINNTASFGDIKIMTPLMPVLRISKVFIY